MIVYFTLTQNVKRFVDKVSGDPIRHQIDPLNAEVAVDQPFILVVPTYVQEITEPVWDFLDTEDNADWCRGIFCSGNLNFAGLYCFTADDLAEEYDLPVLHRFEFQGDESDVDKLEEELARINEEN